MYSSVLIYLQKYISAEMHNYHGVNLHFAWETSYQFRKYIRSARVIPPFTKIPVHNPCNIIQVYLSAVFLRHTRHLNISQSKIWVKEHRHLLHTSNDSRQRFHWYHIISAE